MLVCQWIYQIMNHDEIKHELHPHIWELLQHVSNHSAPSKTAVKTSPQTLGTSSSPQKSRYFFRTSVVFVFPVVHHFSKKIILVNHRSSGSSHGDPLGTAWGSPPWWHGRRWPRIPPRRPLRPWTPWRTWPPLGEVLTFYGYFQ